MRKVQLSCHIVGTQKPHHLTLDEESVAITANRLPPRRPLTDAEVQRLARAEVPELTRHLRSVSRLVDQLVRLHNADPQSDLEGLHAIVDRELAPLALLHGEDVAVRALHDFGLKFPGLRPPLLSKIAVISLLTPPPR